MSATKSVGKEPDAEQDDPEAPSTQKKEVESSKYMSNPDRKAEPWKLEPWQSVEQSQQHQYHNSNKVYFKNGSWCRQTSYDAAILNSQAKSKASKQRILSYDES